VRAHFLGRVGEEGGYHLVWVGYAENDAQKSIRPTAHWGTVAEGYFENVKLTWSEAESGRAPPGRAIRSGLPVLVQDVRREPVPQPWRDYMLRCGCGAWLALPLNIDDRVIGVLNIGAREPDAFGDEEAGLLAEAAADLAFGIAAQRAHVERAQLKLTLKTAEERFRAAAEVSLDALFIARCLRDETGQIVDFEFTNINAHAEEMLGMTRETVIGRKLCELLPVARGIGIFDKYVQVAATGTPLEQEFAIDTPQIKAKWLRQQVVRLNDGVAIFARDVTQWKEAGAAYRKLARQNALILSSAGEGIYGLDGEGRITFINPAAAAMLGWEAEKLIGQNGHAAFHYLKADGTPYPEEECPAHAAHRDGVSHRGIDHVFWKRDGTSFPVEYVSTPIRDEEGELNGAVVVFSDITGRKQAEEALVRESRRNEVFLRNASDGIHILDTDGNVLEVSDAFCEMLGYSREELIGSNVSLWDARWSPQELKQRIAEQIARDRRSVFETRHRRRDGSPLDVEVTGHGLELDGKLVLFNSARDITERKLAEEALRESRARLDLALQSARMGVWRLDIVENKLVFDAQVCRLLGIDPAKFTGTEDEFFGAVHPDDREKLRTALARTVEQDVLFEPEYRAVWPDGSVHYITARARLARDDQGRPMRINGIIWDISARKQGELALERANRALRTLSACNEALVHAATEPELLNTICRRIVDIGGYNMAWVGFAEQDPAKTVRVVAEYGTDEGYLRVTNITWADAERGRGPIGTAIRTGATQVNQNFLTNPNVAPWRDAALARGWQSSIAIPLKGAAGTYGALAIYAREHDAFDGNELQLLEELADDLAFGIATLRTRGERDRMAQAQLHHQEILRKSLEDSVHAIASTLEMRDPYTAGHQSRVAQLANAIARELGLPKDEIHGIELAANIHDLGKIKVPAEILSKPGKLTNLEYELIKVHAQAGYDILKEIEFPWPIADMVLQHHERLDGSGYPQGLKGEQILPEAKILAVADVVEAMASHRPYRPSLGIAAALAEIEKKRGTAFDPAVVDACLKLFGEGQFAFQT